ncbi:ABC transporter permease, partial [Acidobacteriota bacterium]
MLKNYLKMTFRNIKRNKIYSLINIFGLAVGIACCILILLYVVDDLSYDRFHTKADQIYRVVFCSSDDGDPSPTNANGSFGVGPALKKDFPEILESTRIRRMGQGSKLYVGYKERKFYEKRFFFAEPSFFKIFDFSLNRGDPETALSQPNTMVLTESSAEKYFGSEDPIGKLVEADPYNDGKLMQFEVTGIMGDFHANSHVHMDILVSYISQREDLNNFSGFWQHYTYVLLRENAQVEDLQPQFLAFLEAHWRADPWYTLDLQPLLDIHLHSRLRSEVEPNSSILYIYIFTAIAFFILIIACINFMNLTTARSIKRAKEVGLRKVVGAGRKQLIRQFMGESLFLSGLAATVSVLLVFTVLPVFNRLSGKGLTAQTLLSPQFILGIFALTVVVGLVSGIYPAFLLSSFQPIQSLKSGQGVSRAGAFFRRGLVTFQFTLSIGIIIATSVALKQMHHIQTMNIGFDREQLLAIPLNPDLRSTYESFRAELLRNPGIENTTTSSRVPTRGSEHYNFRFEGGTEITQVLYMVDREFLDTYGLRHTAGRNINQEISKENPNEFLVSESSVRESGFKSAEDAVGKGISIDEYQGQIAGVVQDINIYSLRRQPYSVNYCVTSISNHNFLSIRIRPENVSGTLGHIQKTWKNMIP